jgi:dolichol-phosphate mannosyltransferase subunit 3
MAPSRAQVVLLRLLAATAVWLGLWLAAPLPSGTELAVALLPLWALLSFGLYSAVTILWGLLTFPTCPEAAQELAEEVEQARKDLRKRGVLKKA